VTCAIPRRVEQRAREHCALKIDAQGWLDEVTAAVVTGHYGAPKMQGTTVEQWCATWLEGYVTRRASTVRQAEVRVRRPVAAFGPMPLAAVRPRTSSPRRRS
jgi:hypothetical protein